MMPDFLLATLKASAVGGIFMVLAKITVVAFKLSRDIISLKDGTLEPVVKQMAMCEKCNSPYFIDEVDFALCVSCFDDLLEK